MTRGQQRGPAVVDGVQIEAVRRAGLNLYTRPHEDKRPPAFDWSATRPTCSCCSQKSSEVGSDGLCPTCRTPEPAQPTQKAKPAPRSRPAGRRTTPKLRPTTAPAARVRRGPSTRSLIDERSIIAAYRAGAFTSDLATEHGVNPQRIRRVLDRHGVQRRDERALRSGGRPRTYGDDTAARVRQLYVDERLSVAQVAARLDLTYKTVVTLMRRHDIPRRQKQGGHTDGAAPLKARMADLGVTSTQVRAWAQETGLPVSTRGLPSAALVEAWADAHPGSQ